MVDERTLARVSLIAALVVLAGSAIIFESAERLGERIRDVMTFDPDREEPLPPGEVSAVHRAARAILRGGTS